MRTLLTEDYQFTISDIHREMAECYLMQTSHTTIFRILTKELEMKKVSARWVLRMLIADNCQNRIGARLEMPTRYNEKGESLLSWIVTSNET